MATPSEIFQQTKGLVQGLNLRQKLITGGVLAFVLVSFALLFLFVNTETYRTLYSDLAPGDAGEVVTWLKASGHPYRIAQGGSVIQVPEDRVYDLRLELASAGLPKGSGVGFEVFDKTSLGATDFVQQVQYQRALQGELERTIARFPQVKGARIHIAQPRESLFVSDRKESTASVVLDLKNGQILTDQQVKGIVHMVSMAVPRLSKENVTVVDTSGTLLSGDRDGESGLEGLTAAQLAYRKRLEEHLRQKVQSMLDDTIGTSKSVVRVAAELDFDQVQVNEDTFNPDETVVRSEQKLLETNLAGGDGGVPGVKGGLADKLQGNANQGNAGSGGHQRKQDTTNYEISRVQRQVSGAMGKVKRLSVGVLVDGTYKQEGEKAVYVQRTAQEMTGFEEIVKAAVGFSAERGDEISVLNVPFTAREEEAAPGLVSRILDGGWGTFLKPLANLALAALFVIFVLRPLIERYVRRRGEGAAGDAAPGGGGSYALGEGRGIALENLPDARTQLKEIANNYPERAAALVKVWLREDAGAAKGAENARAAKS